MKGPANRPSKPEDSDGPTTWELEEIGEFRSADVAGRSKLWLGSIAVVFSAVVAVGLLGSGRPSSNDQLPAVSPVAPSMTPSVRITPRPDPLTITNPTTGTTVSGNEVEIDGIASEPLGQVHLSVVLGDSVIGWRNIDIASAGPVATSIRVFAPPLEAPVELRVAGGHRLSDTGHAPITAFQLQSGPGLQVWGATVLGDPAVLVLDGYGRASAGVVRVIVRDRDGHVVARGSFALGDDELIPGSAGAHTLGLAGFHHRIALRGSRGAGDLAVEFTWVDAVLGRSKQTIAVRSQPDPGSAAESGSPSR